VQNFDAVKDFQIREVLRKTELQQYFTDGNSKVVEEMKIPAAAARIDLAVINGWFHGYEIKGASDTLQRLPNQLVAYSLVFDYLTVITEEKHYGKICVAAPHWVRVVTCSREGKLAVVREGERNENQSGFHIAKLLWREELLSVLSDLAIPHKKKERNWLLCEAMANALPLNVLCKVVRDKLKDRRGWKTKEGFSAA
jgi:hypothetical protein